MVELAEKDLNVTGSALGGIAVGSPVKFSQQERQGVMGMMFNPMYALDKFKKEGAQATQQKEEERAENIMAQASRMVETGNIPDTRRIEPLSAGDALAGGAQRNQDAVDTNLAAAFARELQRREDVQHLERSWAARCSAGGDLAASRGPMQVS